MAGATSACEIRSPYNAGMTLIGGVPSVAFRPCSPDEGIREIVLIQVGVDGDSRTYTEIWRATPLGIPALANDRFWPLLTSDSRYASSRAGRENVDPASTYIVKVFTTKRRVDVSWRLGDLREERVHIGGATSMPTEKFFSDSKICP